MFLAQGHNAVVPVRLEPPDTRSLVKHSTTTINLNHENKLLYEIKKNPAAILSQKRFYLTF